MKFIRLVASEFSSDIEYISVAVPTNINHFNIEKLCVARADGRPLVIWRFSREMNEDDYSVSNGELTFCRGMLEACHKAIRFFMACLSVETQIRLTITSPIPTFSVEIENEHESSIFSSIQRVTHERVAIHGEDFEFKLKSPIASLTVDRSEGLEILSEAIGLNSDVAKYAEYIKLFEAAFSHAGVGLYKPLLGFLQNSKYEFTKAEVRYWFDHLRSRAIHTDKNEPIFSYEIVRSIEKMKIAAYEVLFNKMNWKSGDIEHRTEMEIISGAGLITAGMPAKLAMRLFDEFGEFPQNVQACIKSLPDNWWYRANEKSTLTVVGG